MVIQLHTHSFTQKIFFEFKVFMSSSLIPIYSPSKSESARMVCTAYLCVCVTHTQYKHVTNMSCTIVTSKYTQNTRNCNVIHKISYFQHVRYTHQPSCTYTYINYLSGATKSKGPTSAKKFSSRAAFISSASSGYFRTKNLPLISP